MEQHNRFLRDSVPSLSRFGGHSNSCPFLRGGNCSCNNGAYTFADYEDIEAQLLKPGNTNGAKNIHRLKPGTACGLQNINHVFNTTNATDALDAAVSIGAVVPGQNRGTGNMLFGEGVFITKTFVYLRHVLSAAFDLISQLREAIASLVQNLYAADARNAELEAKQADLAAQNKSLVEQLRINKEECDALAQRCRLAEEKNDLLNLTATRSLAEQSEKHKREGGVLWARYTLDIGEARRALEAEKAAHWRTLEAASMRGVSGAPQSRRRPPRSRRGSLPCSPRSMCQSDGCRFLSFLPLCHCSVRHGPKPQAAQPLCKICAKNHKRQ